MIPVYNGAAFLPTTIDSLFAQTHKDFEIIVVDDGSTDSAEKLKRHYIRMSFGAKPHPEKSHCSVLTSLSPFSLSGGPLKSNYSEEQVSRCDTKIIWITNKDRHGAAYCRNIGNKMASGDIIAVCDAGDHYIPERGAVIEKMFHEKQCDIVYTAVQVSFPSGTAQFTQEAKEWDGKSKPGISHPTVAYLKKVADYQQYHEESVDTDLYELFLLDVFKAGYKFGFENIVTCVKVDLTGSKSYRDVKAAKELKKKRFSDYGVPYNG